MSRSPLSGLAWWRFFVGEAETARSRRFNGPLLVGRSGAAKRTCGGRSARGGGRGLPRSGPEFEGAVGVEFLSYITDKKGFCHILQQLSSENSFEEEQPGKEKLSRPVLETTTKEEPGWPSFGQLLIDLCKFALEFLTSHIVPARFKTSSSLRPLKDRLKMPEEEKEPPLVQRHTAPAPISESRHAHLPKPSDSYPEHKTAKLRSSSAIKDPTLSSSKHHRSSSKRQDYTQFYASGEVIQPKIHKERSRRRHRDKTTDTEPKTTASETVKPVEYSNSSKFDHYNMRSSKYGPETPFRF